jgi:hypothetical protein
MILSKSAIIATALGIVGSESGEWLEHHTISLATAVAVGSVLLPFVWWMSGELRGLKDTQQQLQRELQQRFDAGQQLLEELRRRGPTRMAKDLTDETSN